ncbi:hypothetical protein U3516DRAFT_768732 [Neocallimastix sp. 'constans']
MISTVSDYNGHQVGQWYDSVPQLVNCDGKLGPVDYFCLTVINTLPEYIERNNNNNNNNNQSNLWVHGNNNNQSNLWVHGNNNNQSNLWVHGNNNNQSNLWVHGNNNNQSNLWVHGNNNNQSNLLLLNGGNCAPLWEYCDGLRFNDAKCCSKSSCKMINKNYSQSQN